VGDCSSRKMPVNSSSNNGGFLSWLRHPQRGLPYLIFSIVAILIIIPLLTHYYISAFDDVVTSSYGHRGRFERAGRFGSTKSSELKSQIDELRAIKTSVSNELLELEKKRQTLLTDISGYTSAIDELKQSYRQTSEELGRLKVSLTSLQVSKHLQLFSCLFSAVNVTGTFVSTLFVNTDIVESKSTRLTYLLYRRLSLLVISAFLL